MIAFLGASFTVEGQTVEIYPRYGTVVAKVHRPRVVVHNGANFYFANGVWYRPHGRKYIVCKAPIGLRVRYLPKGYRVVRINGKKYYRYNGIYYTKKRGYFTVIRVG